jgi:hypothetical protein
MVAPSFESWTVRPRCPVLPAAPRLLNGCGLRACVRSAICALLESCMHPLCHVPIGMSTASVYWRADARQGRLKLAGVKVIQQHGLFCPSDAKYCKTGYQYGVDVCHRKRRSLSPSRPRVPERY